MNESQPLITKGHWLGISEFYIKVTDQMGVAEMKGFQEIIELLNTKHVKELEEVKEIRSMGMEIMK